MFVSRTAGNGDHARAELRVADIYIKHECAPWKTPASHHEAWLKHLYSTRRAASIEPGSRREE